MTLVTIGIPVSALLLGLIISWPRDKGTIRPQRVADKLGFWAVLISLLIVIIISLFELIPLPSLIAVAVSLSFVAQSLLLVNPGKGRVFAHLLHFLAGLVFMLGMFLYLVETF